MIALLETEMLDQRGDLGIGFRWRLEVFLGNISMLQHSISGENISIARSTEFAFWSVLGSSVSYRMLSKPVTSSLITDW